MWPRSSDLGHFQTFAKSLVPQQRSCIDASYFDPYLLGHAEKDHLVDGPYYKRVYRNQGWISPVVLWNGKAIGTWSSARRGKRLSLQIEPFEKFSRMMRARIEEEAAGWGSFLETPWEIQFGQ